MNEQEMVFQKLDAMKIEYTVHHHQAAYTVEDMERFEVTQYGDVCKNLFLRDGNGARHFLVVMDKDKKADLKGIQAQLGCSRLSFASEDRLFKYLHLQKGSVTPLGVMNDPECKVEVAVDKDLMGKNRLGVHPNDNRATVWISFEDLKKVIECNGNRMHFITI